MIVSQAMQKVVSSMHTNASMGDCIRQMIRSKTDAVLVVDNRDHPMGVVSKTDIMGAFYGALPKESHLEDIMMGPVQLCSQDDGIDTVLDAMKTRGIHQLFVKDTQEEQIVGKLEYSDIGGLLYRYCRNCRKSRRHPEELENLKLPRLLVKEVMTGRVEVCKITDSLYQVMDLLSSRKLKAVPIVDDTGLAKGIISKTDLVVSYAHDISPESHAGDVMNAPVVSCGPDELLSQAILRMFITDIGHLFVLDPESDELLGVVSLSDAARFRSGTCRACSASRIF